MDFILTILDFKEIGMEKLFRLGMNIALPTNSKN
jgi:hypothetical protein